MTARTEEPQDWPLRPWLLAALLGGAGLLIYHIGGGQGPDTRIGWQAAVSAFLFFGPLAFAFTLERDRWRAPLGFSFGAGLVMAGLAWRAVGQAETIADPQYGFMAGLVATALALPLFQAGFHRSRWATPYRAIHGHVWSDAICAAGSLAFVGASWLMLVLLSELFHLLKIDILKNLIDDGWFGWSWSGAAFGAALGVFRNELGIIGTLRRVVMTVLSLLAVPLAAGLALFLVAMVISGPEVLWEATRSATPVLLSCAAGAWVLANAILRDEDVAMSGNRVLRIAGLVLVLAILPLTVFAAVSMGTRVAQHGLSPERLWGLVAIAVAVAYGLAWLVAVARGWKAGEWRERVRCANLYLAVVISALALFLALPILDFGAISARQQIERLKTGEVPIAEFDFYALQTQFGSAGRETVNELIDSANPAIARSAKSAVARARREAKEARAPVGTLAAGVVDFRFDDPRLREMVKARVASDQWFCRHECAAIDVGTRGNVRTVALVDYNGLTLLRFRANDGMWLPAARPPPPTFVEDISSARIEVRDRPMRQIFVDGKPMGQPFDEAPLEGAPPPR